MGISTYYSVFYGILYENPSSELTDFTEDLYESGLDHCYDAMSGEYLILGVKLAKSMDFRWEDGHGDNFKIIPLDQLQKFEEQYKEAFIKEFPDKEGYINKPFKMMAFVHYS